MKDNFVHIHLHSEHSTLDGHGKICDYAEKAAERGNIALGMSDHGTISGCIELTKECDKNNIKPLYGCELYITRDRFYRGLSEEQKKIAKIKYPKERTRNGHIAKYESELGVGGRWHITVYAMTEKGVKNLFKLASLANTEGFFIKPRIDFSLLWENNEGLIVSSGCCSAAWHDLVANGKDSEAVELFDRTMDVFGDRFYLEIMGHSFGPQADANKWLVKQKERFPNAKFIATQDAHYVNPEDAAPHDCLLCIGTNSKAEQGDRFEFDTSDFFMKDRKGVEDLFATHHSYLPNSIVKEGCDSTIEFAERCSAKIELDPLKGILPKVPLPKGISEDEHLRQLCRDGFKNKIQGNVAKEKIHEYVDRIKYELSVIESMGFALYFLVIENLVKNSNRSGIMTGPGRGSSAGSLVAYLLSITTVDPIKHGLFFERFLNIERNDFPDIDIDFQSDRHSEVYGILEDTYGKDSVARIRTKGKMKAKAAFKDACRVYNIPLAESERATKLLPDVDQKSGLILQTLNSKDCPSELKAFIEKYRSQLEETAKKKHESATFESILDGMEGLTKSKGMHAAGAIVTPGPVYEFAPVELGKEKVGGDRWQTFSLDMTECADLGLIKIDILGLKDLTKIKCAIKAIEDYYDKKIDLMSINMEDPKVLNEFSNMNFTGVFQYDSDSAYRACNGLKFNRFEDIAVVTSLNRPGPLESGLLEQYKAKLKSGKVSHDFHPVITEITSDSYGVLCYQEQIMKIFSDVAGYSLGEADKVRKAIGKKLAPEKLNVHRKALVDGCIKIGMNEGRANKLMDAIVKFAGYAFNKSHAVSYAYLAYWCMWLKVYYPAQFYAGLLSVEDEKSKVDKIISECKKLNIVVDAMCVSSSKKNYGCSGPGRITPALQGIKGVGGKAVDKIIEGQPYKSIGDFVLRSGANRSVIEALAKAGAFYRLASTKFVIENLDAIQKEPTNYFGDYTNEPEYPRFEKIMLSADVCSSGEFAHPADIWLNMCKNFGIKPLQEGVGGDFFEKNDGKSFWILGTKNSLKKMEKVVKSPKDKPLSGLPFANLKVDNSSGSYKVKFDYHNWGDYRDKIDVTGEIPILARCTATRWGSAFVAAYAVNLKDLYRSFAKKEELTLDQRLVCGKLAGLGINGRRGTGILVSRQKKYSKNGLYLVIWIETGKRLLELKVYGGKDVSLLKSIEKADLGIRVSFEFSESAEWGASLRSISRTQ